MNKVEHLKIRMKKGSESAWNYILQKGVFFPAKSGMSVREFLNVSLAFDDDFIDSTVRTIFLNNSPVDDIDDAFLKEGDRMALGSAMPGLVGIVMGRDNPFKSFRSDISAHAEEKTDDRQPISISMKIFSVLAVKSGADLLKRGVSIDAQVLSAFLSEKIGDIVAIDGMDQDGLLERLSDTRDNISLQATFSK